MPYQVLAQVIEDSDGGGADVAGTTGGASGVVGGAEDVASSVGTIGDAVEAGGMIFVGISACCASVPVVVAHLVVTLEVLAYLGLALGGAT